MGIIATIVVFTTFSINLLIGLIAYQNNPKSWTNRLIGVLALVFSFWTVGNFFALSPGTELNRLFWIRLVMVFTAPMGPSTFLLSKAFPNKDLGISKKFLTAITLITVGIMFLALSPWMFTKVTNLPNNNFELTPGPAIALFAISHFLFTTLGLVALFNKLKKSSGLVKQQLLWFLWGQIITLILITLSNFVAVVFFGSMQYTFIGPTFTLIQVGLTTYAIIKHRLLNIKMAIYRTVSFSLLILIMGFITGSGLVAITQFVPKNSRDIIQLILILIIASLFQPTKKLIQKITEKIFYKNAYNSTALLDDLGHITTSTLSLRSITSKTLRKLTHTIHISKASFIIIDSNKETIANSLHYKNPPSLSDSSIKNLVKQIKHKPTIFEDIAKKSTKEIFKKLEASAIIPLYNSGKIHGLLVLGVKKSGDIFSQQDIQVFNIFAPQISVAVQNSLAYEKAKHFNKILREEVKIATEKLRKANKNLRHLDKIKDEFVYIATHELKNPVTAMRGYLSMMKEGSFGKIPKNLKEPLTQLNQSNHQLVSLVNDLLQIARAEAKTLRVNMSPINICSTIEQTIGNLMPLIEQKNLSIKYVHKKDSIMVEADPDRIKEVFNNLITNAIKYSSKGTIVISHITEGPHIITHVKDQGVGIAKKDQKKIFTRFFRVEEEVIKGVPGSGLGLFIVRQLVEKMNGKIWFTTKYGEGTTFSFSLLKA